MFIFHCLVVVVRYDYCLFTVPYYFAIMLFCPFLLWSVSVNQLKTWYDGMRTRFARISSTRSGQVPVLDELTERDR